MTPLAQRKSHKTLLVRITLIWTIGIIVAFPAALFSEAKKDLEPHNIGVGSQKMEKI